MPIQFIKCVRERVRESGRECVRVRRHTHSYRWRFRYAPQHFGKQVLHTWNFCDWCALATFAIAAITACRCLTLMSLTVSPCHACVYVCVCTRVCVCASWASKSFNCFLQLELLVSAPAYNCLAASVDCTAAASQFKPPQVAPHTFFCPSL